MTAAAVKRAKSVVFCDRCDREVGRRWPCKVCGLRVCGTCYRNWHHHREARTHGER